MRETSDIRSDGMVVLSEKPGFGVELDDEQLKTTRIG